MVLDLSACGQKVKAPDLIRGVVSDPSAPFLTCTSAGLLPNEAETGDWENDAMFSQKVTGECGYSPPVRNVSVKSLALSADHPDCLILFRRYVSRKAAGKARAVLEGVGLDSPTIDACVSANALDDEETVQDGLTRWCVGEGTQPPTWKVLFKAMKHAEMTIWTIQRTLGMKAELRMLFAVVCV